MRDNPAVPAKVLFVENSIGLGGSTMSLCTLLNHLDRRVFEPCIAVSRPEQERYLHRNLRQEAETALISPRECLKRARLGSVARAAAGVLGEGSHRACLRLLGLLDTPFRTVPYALRLFRFARNQGVSLIHQNNGFDTGAALASALLGTPLVTYQRGDEWDSPLVRRLARRVDQYIANSRATGASLVALGIPSEKIQVIYPPLDLEVFRPGEPSPSTRADLSIPRTAPCFGIIGVLVPWKGHRVFLAAARRVLARHPDAWALVVGAAPTGEEGYEAELRALARELGIAHRVVFTGFRDDVGAILRALDVVVHASVEPEPFGRVIVEAMASKRAVVAARAGGPTEIIVDGENGFLTEPGDDRALAVGVIRLLEDPALAGRIAEQGYRDATGLFAAPRHAALVQAVYAAAIGIASPDVRAIGRPEAAPRVSRN